MIAIPALDLRERACVQLEGGDYARERVRIADPLEVARVWARAGFRALHVVDLDAATGRGSNAGVVRELRAARTAAVQVGGGIRSARAIAALLRSGSERVVVGTRAIEDAAWLAAAAARFPGRIVVAADVRGRSVVTRGWSRTLALDVAALVETIDSLPLAGVLVTAVHREGRLEGADLALMEEVAARARVPLFAAGGIRGMDDLRALAHAGIRAAILGMALYTGALDPRAVAEEFAT